MTVHVMEETDTRVAEEMNVEVVAEAMDSLDDSVIDALSQEM